MNWDDLSEEGVTVSSDDEGAEMVVESLMQSSEEKDDSRQEEEDLSNRVNEIRARLATRRATAAKEKLSKQDKVDVVAPGDNVRTKKSAIDWDKLSDSESESDDSYDETGTASKPASEHDESDGESDSACDSDDESESASAAGAAATAAVKMRIFAALEEEERIAEEERLEMEELKRQQRERNSSNGGDGGRRGHRHSKSSEAHDASSPWRSHKKSKKKKSSKKSASSSSSSSSSSPSGSASSLAAASHSGPPPPPLADYVVSYVLDDWMSMHNNQRPERVIRQGYLEKTGPNNRNWQRRWVVLYAERVEYFKSFGDVKPLGAIPVDSITSVDSINKKKPEFRVLTSGRTFSMMASNDQDRLDWIHMIDVSRKMLDIKLAYRDADDSSRQRGALSAKSRQILLDIHIPSLAQKKTLPLNVNIKCGALTPLIVRKFPHLPQIANFRLFVVKHQRFLGELVDDERPIAELLTDRDLVELRSDSQASMQK
jgi:PH domain